jgi:hypothetical protein
LKKGLARSSVWHVWAGLLIYAVPLACAAIGWWMAASNNRSPLEGMLLGFFLGPVGLLIEALLPKGPADYRTARRVLAVVAALYLGGTVFAIMSLSASSGGVLTDVLIFGAAISTAFFVFLVIAPSKPHRRELRHLDR